MTDQQDTGNPPASIGAGIGDLLHLAGGEAALAVAAAAGMQHAISHLEDADMLPQEHAALVQAHATLAQALYTGALVHYAQSASDALAAIAHEVGENFHLGSIADVLGRIAHDLHRVDSR